MSGCKTTYSTDVKQLYIPQKFSNLVLARYLEHHRDAQSLYSNDVITIYVNDVISAIWPSGTLGFYYVPPDVGT